MMSCAVNSIWPMRLSERGFRAGLTQSAVAERMHTSQAAVARLESGRQSPSYRSLQKYAEAIGARLKIDLEPM